MSPCHDTAMRGRRYSNALLSLLRASICSSVSLIANSFPGFNNKPIIAGLCGFVKLFFGGSLLRFFQQLL
jgi:hypothetical protein